jgi:hypothetical protein
MKVRYLWLPVVPADGPPVPPGRQGVKAPDTPRRTLAVVTGMDTDDSEKRVARGGAAGRGDLLRLMKERDGYQGVVINGLKPIPPAAMKKLREVAPDTEEVLVIDSRVDPVPAALMEERREVARNTSAAGGGALLFAVVWAVVVSRRLHRRAPAPVSP